MLFAAVARMASLPASSFWSLVGLAEENSEPVRPAQVRCTPRSLVQCTAQPEVWSFEVCCASQDTDASRPLLSARRGRSDEQVQEQHSSDLDLDRTTPVGITDEASKHEEQPSRAASLTTPNFLKLKQKKPRPGVADNRPLLAHGSEINSEAGLLPWQQAVVHRRPRVDDDLESALKFWDQREDAGDASASGGRKDAGCGSQMLQGVWPGDAIVPNLQPEMTHLQEQGMQAGAQAASESGTTLTSAHACESPEFLLVTLKDSRSLGTGPIFAHAHAHAHAPQSQLREGGIDQSRSKTGEPVVKKLSTPSSFAVAQKDSEGFEDDLVPETPGGLPGAFATAPHGSAFRRLDLSGVAVTSALDRGVYPSPLIPRDHMPAKAAQNVRHPTYLTNGIGIQRPCHNAAATASSAISQQGDGDETLPKLFIM